MTNENSHTDAYVRELIRIKEEHLVDLLELNPYATNEHGELIETAIKEINQLKRMLALV
jgi:hypothetical protein